MDVRLGLSRREMRELVYVQILYFKVIKSCETSLTPRIDERKKSYPTNFLKSTF